MPMGPVEPLLYPLGMSGIAVSHSFGVLCFVFVVVFLMSGGILRVYYYLFVSVAEPLGLL